MRYTFNNRSFPAGNPVANAVVIVFGAIAILASIVVGFFAAVVLGAALLIVAAVIGIRLWWLRRKMPASGNAPGSKSSVQREGSQTIEGEYRIIVNEHDDAGR